MVLNFNCEPLMHPVEMVTLDRVKNDLQQEMYEPEEGMETDTNHLKDLEVVSFDITPMFDMKNQNYHLIQSLSFDNNKYLKCRWEEAMLNYSQDTKITKQPLQFSHKSEDYYFRCNIVQEKPLDSCRPLRKMLNGTILKRMPIPTEPRPIKKYEKKTKRGYATDDFLKRHTKPFQGLKKSKKNSKNGEEGSCK